MYYIFNEFFWYRGDTVDKSRTEYAFLNVLTGLGGYILITVLGFVSRMVFVRCLSSAYLGINGLFTNILSLLSLAELGVGSAISYELYNPLANKNTKKVASLVDFYRKAYILIGVIVGIFGVILLPFIKGAVGSYPFKENIYVIYLLFLFNSVISYFFSYRTSLLQADQKQYVVSATQYVFLFLQNVVQIVFLIVTREYIFYLVTQIICTVLFNVTISRIAIKKYPYLADKNIEKLSISEIQHILKNIWYLLTNKLSSILLNSTDNIIVSYFKGIVSVGLTSNYVLLTDTLSSFISQFFNGLTGSIGNYNVLKSREETKDLFYCFNFANFWLFGFGSLGIIFVSSDLVNICFGNKYVLPIYFPIVLAINFFVVGMMNSIWSFKYALGQFKYGRYIVLLTGVFNIVFSLILGKQLGLFGIYLATIISRLLTNFWYEPYALFKYSLHTNTIEYFIVYIKYVVIYIIAFSFNYLGYSFISLPPILSLLVHTIMCTIITNIIFYVFLRKKKEFLFFKRKVMILINLIKSKLIDKI